jgi:hypothetical protein
MSAAPLPIPPTDDGPPRLGILVDCKKSCIKGSKSPVLAAPPAVPVAKTFAPPPARSVPAWILPATGAGLGLLFVLSLGAGALYAWLTSPRPTAAVAGPQKSVVPAAVVAKAPKVVKHQDAVPAKAASQPKVQATIPASPGKAVTPAPAPAALEVAKEFVGPPAPPPRDESTPAQVEVAQAEPAPPPEAAKVSLKALAPREGDSCDPSTCKPGGDFYGTAVAFVATPHLAAEEAARQHKLQFVLHVSGNFEDPGFT